MTLTTLTQIINQLDFLETDELKQLNQAIQVRLTPVRELNKLAAFYDSLLTSGLVQQIKYPSSNQIKRQLVKVQGKSLSETIIEERR